MTRAVVSVATTAYFRRGQERLYRTLGEIDTLDANTMPLCFQQLGGDWPTHQEKPFAFKAYALKHAADTYKPDLLLWCDACILPVRSMEPAWAHIEKYGALFMNNGFSNAEWTADSAYPELFAKEHSRLEEAIPHTGWKAEEESAARHRWLEAARAINRRIKHTVGGFFGLNLRHDTGRAILAEIYRLASETRAFCGPSFNLNHKDCPTSHATVCGPADVRGHRHDQTALSVLAWRYGVDLVDPPKFFIYGKSQDAQDERTVVVADGSYA